MKQSTELIKLDAYFINSDFWVPKIVVGLVKCKELTTKEFIINGNYAH